MRYIREDRHINGLIDRPLVDSYKQTNKQIDRYTKVLKVNSVS